MAKLATLWSESGRIRLRFDYNRALVEAFKGLVQPAHRSWTPEGKTWSFDPAYLDQVHALLTTHGYEVTVLSSQAPPPPQLASGQSPEARYLEGLSDEVLRKIHRVVAFELHPDRGGNPDVLARLNSTMDEIRRRRGVK